MMVHELISTACVEIYGGSSCGVGGVGEKLQELHAQSLIRQYSAAFTIPEHFECTQPEHFKCTQPEQRLHK